MARLSGPGPGRVVSQSLAWPPGRHERQTADRTTHKASALFILAEIVAVGARVGQIHRRGPWSVVRGLVVTTFPALKLVPTRCQIPGSYVRI